MAPASDGAIAKLGRPSSRRKVGDEDVRRVLWEFATTLRNALASVAASLRAKSGAYRARGVAFRRSGPELVPKSVLEKHAVTRTGDRIRLRAASDHALRQ